MADRVAAHRNRLHSVHAEQQEPAVADTEERRRAAKIAAAVAARYAAAPSYMATQWPSELPEKKQEIHLETPKPEAELSTAAHDEPVQAEFLTETFAPPVAPPIETRKKPSLAAVVAAGPRIQMLPEPPETLAPELLPVRVIEFPRELIAVRRLRPRLAEAGAVCSSGLPASSGQLRIFEVEPDQISTTPEPPPALPESIHAALLPQATPQRTRLELADAVDLEFAEAAYPPAPMENMAPGRRASNHASTVVLLTAPLDLRVMSALVDGCIVSVITMVAAMMWATRASHLPQLKVFLLGLGAAYVTLWIVYQLLCFVVGDATLGMRYARIGLCTFDDENPSRAAMCWRVPVQLLSLCPLGLGYIWAWMDMDRLGWHDRITHMYQRNY